MIDRIYTVDYEVVRNEKREEGKQIRESKQIEFSALNELADWIFGQMQQEYDASFSMYFPTPDTSANADGPESIEFVPVYGGPSFFIHQIRRGDGILFSDGRFTCGQKHWSKEVKGWLTQCEKRRRNPYFKFVD